MCFALAASAKHTKNSLGNHCQINHNHCQINHSLLSLVGPKVRWAVSVVAMTYSRVSERIYSLRSTYTRVRFARLY